MALVEGKNREIRRTMEHFGLTVSRLQRLRYGPYTLDGIDRGAVLQVPIRTDILRKAKEWIENARAADDKGKGSFSGSRGPGNRGPGNRGPGSNGRKDLKHVVGSSTEQRHSGQAEAARGRQ